MRKDVITQSSNSLALSGLNGSISSKTVFSCLLHAFFFSSSYFPREEGETLKHSRDCNFLRRRGKGLNKRRGQYSTMSSQKSTLREKKEGFRSQVGQSRQAGIERRKAEDEDIKGRQTSKGRRKHSSGLWSQAFAHLPSTVRHPSFLAPITNAKKSRDPIEFSMHVSFGIIVH